MQRKQACLFLLFAVAVPGCSFLTDFDGYTFEDSGVPDGGGDSGPDETPPTVVTSSPEGTLVDGRTPVVVTFSEAIATNASDVTVTLDTAVTLEGTISVTGDTLRFTPDSPFSQMGTYDVVIGTGITDLAGNPLAAAYTFSFGVPATGNGGAPSVRLDTVGSGAVACPHLAMDDDGNAMVLFQRGSDLHTAYYRAGVGWGATQELAEGSDGVLAMSPGGRIAVAYTGTVAGVSRTLVRTAPGQGDTTFGSASLADEGAAHAVDAWGTCTLNNQTKNVAINDAGVVAVVWKVSTPTGGDPIVGWTFNRRDSSGNWDVPVFTSNSPFDSWPEKPGLAVDSAGNVESVYRTFVGTGYVHGYRRYDVAAGSWLTATNVDAADALYAPRVVVDRNDDFMFGLAIYDFVGGAYDTVVRSRDFGGIAARPTLTYELSSTPTHVWVTSVNGPWAIWRNGSFFGVSGFFGVNWDTHSAFLSDSDARNPIIVGTRNGGTDQARGVMVYEQTGEVRTSAVVYGQFGIDSALPRVLPTGTFPAHDPRLVYDDPGQHGIITWITDDPEGAQLFATEFHSLPPSTL